MCEGHFLFSLVEKYQVPKMTDGTLAVVLDSIALGGT